MAWQSLGLGSHLPISIHAGTSLAFSSSIIAPDFPLAYAASMNKRILILDGSINHSVYRPVEEWSRTFGDVPFDAIHLPSHAPVHSLDRYTHVLLTGSEASLMTPELWFKVEAGIVCDAVDRGLAVLGSCFGHQMLAWALSGSEFVRRAPIPELGWVAIDIAKPDALLAGLPSPWHAFAAHLDEVVAPPPPWNVLAANAACAVQAMRYGDHPVWGIQPHPETSPDEAVFQMKALMDQYPEYAQQIRQAIESPVRDDGVTAALIAAFLRS
jgi:GMP synthase-like glutamine amidotransferase